ncbi:MAG: ABC transporter permease [Xanthomonadales bacterium]|nr:ABC transporter permease [Xanthomonadales bacterium]MCP5473890.1 ABC transporter permease [Rhodanobacteraceae bacterium]
MPETQSPVADRHPLLSLLGGASVIVPLLGLLLLGALAVLTPWMWPYSPEQPLWGQDLLAPGIAHGHWFGTDAIGRDMLARTLAGIGVSLAIGLGAGVLALLVGALIGGIAGYAGGWVDEALMRTNDVLLSLPLMLIAILVIALFEPSLWALILVVGGFGSLDAARILRPEARRLRTTEFMLASQLQGASATAQIARHLLPNLLPVALTAFGSVVTQAILVESFLAFLGLGPSETVGSLGTLLAEGVQDLQWAPWTLWIPAAALALVLLGFGLLGDALRQRLRYLTGSSD